jgi:dihydrolipoamide dehydrogenase
MAFLIIKSACIVALNYTIHVENDIIILMPEFDLAILGGGPAGYVAALRAAQLGAKVALIEKDKVGGTCLNRGCIPTKALITCTNFYEKIRKAQDLGIKVEKISLEVTKIFQRKKQIVERLVKGVEFLLRKNQVELIWGVGKILAPNKIEVRDQNENRFEISSKRLILATGSSALPLPGANFDHERFLSSDDLLEEKLLPKKLNIMGGGVIGIHFAFIFSTLGSEVTIYEIQPEILPECDQEIVKNFKKILAAKKIKLLTGTRFDPKQTSDPTLICIGRRPNLSGLENLPLKIENHRVWVNEKMETNLPGIYAAGDLVSTKMFAHVAFEQGIVAAENALGKNRIFSYEAIPYALYTIPEIAGVGYTEKQAQEKFGEIKVGKFPFAALGIAHAQGETEGFIKVIADQKNKILGVHILGANASELLGSATIAIKNGLTVKQLGEVFQAHPSYQEGLQEAALNALKKSLHIIN